MNAYYEPKAIARVYASKARAYVESETRAHVTAPTTSGELRNRVARVRAEPFWTKNSPRLASDI
jgi:hypothetical protein